MKIKIPLDVIILSVAAFSPSACGHDNLWVYNDMQESAHVWVKSEHESRRQWQHAQIGRERYGKFNLNSPDRYCVVVQDLQGGEYSGDLLAIRAALAKQPEAILRLSGEFKVQTQTKLRWTPNGWIAETESVRVRSAVVLHVQTPEGELLQKMIVKPTSNWKRRTSAGRR